MIPKTFDRNQNLTLITITYSSPIMGGDFYVPLLRADMIKISGQLGSVNRSGDLLAANACLMQLQADLARQKAQSNKPHNPCPPMASQEEIPEDMVMPASDWVPELQVQQEKDVVDQTKLEEFACTDTNPKLQNNQIDQSPSASIYVYPTILQSMLETGLASAGRVWLLARYLDKTGKGWIAVDKLKQVLTGSSAEMKICGWRRLRQLLQLGKQTLWERDAFGRIWLYGTKRVASNFNIERLHGKAVDLPLESLTGTIAQVKAAFYASFHAGRSDTPISRATVRRLTGVSERAQQNYDHLANVKRQTNFCLDAPLHAKDPHELAYRHGNATFTFIDYKGNFGPEGQKYHAHQLPNSYTAAYESKRSRQQKKLNQQLKIDLVTQEVQGNSLQSTYLPKRYFDSSKAYAKSRSIRNCYLKCPSSYKQVLWVQN